MTGEDFCTLLAVRADGIASVVDLSPGADVAPALVRARRLLAEHASCVRVEIWRDGAMIEQIDRD